MSELYGINDELPEDLNPDEKLDDVKPDTDETHDDSEEDAE
ncbi:MAG TPA: hypothetical protein VFJ93_07800 [Gaiellaceae bacterium]|nr:hypothetical protein [Gaiellaceae bacterium]